jgi:tryptophan synthase alpha chain
MLPHIIENIRKRSDITMHVMTCYNPVFKYGANRFFRDISAAGASAVLITDLPPEEWGESLEVARSHGLGAIFLVTPTTPIKRMEMINEISEPFVYCVSRAGITGTADELPPEIASYVSFVKEVVTTPLLVGFGISTPEHAKAISRIADGVIIGSAIAAIIEKNLGSEAQMLKALEQFVSGARAAMDA